MHIAESTKTYLLKCLALLTWIKNKKILPGHNEEVVQKVTAFDGQLNRNSKNAKVCHSRCLPRTPDKTGEKTIVRNMKLTILFHKDW